MSFWDAKLAEKSKEKSDYEASTHYMDENKSHWSPVKNNATNAGAPPSMERSVTTRMDVPTARHLLLHACNDISRMREAMEVGCRRSFLSICEGFKAYNMDTIEEVLRNMSVLAFLNLYMLCHIRIASFFPCR